MAIAVSRGRVGAAVTTDFLKFTRPCSSTDAPRLGDIKEAEEFLRSMPELSYEVTKINQMGKRQSRILKLTGTGIQNVRPKNSVISSFHTYEKVKQALMRDFQTLVIKYYDEHDYVYTSPVCIQILQEITTRLQIKKTTEKKKLGFDIALNYQNKLKEQRENEQYKSPTSPRGAITATVTVNSTTMTATNMQPGETRAPTPPTTQSPSPSPTSPLSSPRIHHLPTSTTQYLGETVQIGQVTDAVEEEKKHQKAQKLCKFFGTTEEQRLQAAVDRYTWDPSTVEGKTTQDFVANIQVLENNPLTFIQNIRNFLDQMREYIIEHRGEELSKLMVEVAHQSYKLEDVSLSSVIERSLETAVIMRVKKQIYATLRQKITQLRTGPPFAFIVRALRSKPQSFFGIPEGHVSPSNWTTAAIELNGMAQCELPCDKLATLVNTAKAIYNCFNREQNKGTGAEKNTLFLSADDFLPIFIYVVVQALDDQAEEDEEFMWALCDPEQLNGEGGYYLTVLGSALLYLQNVDLNKL